MALELWLNGQKRIFDALDSGCALNRLVDALALKSDRVAIELNGEIVSRKVWPRTTLNTGDKLEVVHFVGGG